MNDDDDDDNLSGVDFMVIESKRREQEQNEGRISVQKRHAMYPRI